MTLCDVTTLSKVVFNSGLNAAKHPILLEETPVLFRLESNFKLPMVFKRPLYRSADRLIVVAPETDSKEGIFGDEAN